VNHYERLGAAPDATPAQLRDAYRRAARAAHPDRTGDTTSGEMAAINESYRVLSDPELRRRYDRERVQTSSPPGGSSIAPVADGRDDAPEWAHDPAVMTPGRFPWRFLLVMGCLAIVVVVIAAVVIDPPAEAPIDNVLRPGDCVVLTPALEAAEAACSGPHDATVQLLVPFDQTCPTGSEAYRDRQGMGTACVVRVVATGASAS